MYSRPCISGWCFSRPVAGFSRHHWHPKYPAISKRRCTNAVAFTRSRGPPRVIAMLNIVQSGEAHTKSKWSCAKAALSSVVCGLLERGLFGGIVPPPFLTPSVPPSLPPSLSLNPSLPPSFPPSAFFPSFASSFPRFLPSFPPLPPSIPRLHNRLPPFVSLHPLFPSLLPSSTWRLRIVSTLAPEAFSD